MKRNAFVITGFSIAVLAGVLSCFAIAAESNGALVTNINGTASIFAGKENKWVPLSLLTELIVNDRIRVKEKGTVRMVFYSDTHPVLLTGPCQIKILANSCVVEEGEKTCMSASEPYKGMKALASIRASSEKIGGTYARKRPYQIAIISPKGKGVNLRPLFLWKSVKGATGYKLWVRTMNSETIKECTTPGIDFQYPDTAPSLEPGSTYLYTIYAYREGEKIAEGTSGFQIVNRDLLEKYESLRAQMNPELHKNPADMTPYAVLLAFSLGNELYDEALELCLKMQQSTVNEKNYHYILGVIYTAKNLEEEAKAEFGKAGREPLQ